MRVPRLSEIVDYCFFAHEYIEIKIAGEGEWKDVQVVRAGSRLLDSIRDYEVEYFDRATHEEAIVKIGVRKPKGLRLEEDGRLIEINEGVLRVKDSDGFGFETKNFDIKSEEELKEFAKTVDEIKDIMEG